MPRFYRLALGGIANDYWPDDVYSVAISFERDRPCVAMEQGCEGAEQEIIRVVSPAEALRHESHLRLSNGLWLRPYLERMASGEVVTADEVLADYSARYPMDRNGPVSFVSDDRR